MPELSPDDSKQLAAAKALELVTPGMRLGLGTGTTAAHFVALLGARVAKGLDVICVPTSERTRTLAALYSIPLTTIDASPELDLTVDGADEFDPKLRLIKGGGGALLREKIVAMASKRMIVIADSSKLAAVLGKFPLPLEVNVFGFEATRRMVSAAAKGLGCDGELRLRKPREGPGHDNGHYFVGASSAPLPIRTAERTGSPPFQASSNTGFSLGLPRR
jgi:ribose 5-phosphate isomerase A